MNERTKIAVDGNGDPVAEVGGKPQIEALLVAPAGIEDLYVRYRGEIESGADCLGCAFPMTLEQFTAVYSK